MKVEGFDTRAALRYMTSTHTQEQLDRVRIRKTSSKKETQERNKT